MSTFLRHFQEDPGAGIRTGGGLRVFLVVFPVAFVLNVLAFRFIGRWEAPPVPGDTQDYDNIAINLSHGRGFGYDWSDAEWRSAYAAHNQAGLYDGILAREGAYAPTSYRPPVLPAAIALAYMVFGRSFLAWGLINCVIVAAAIALAALLAYRLAGAFPSAAVAFIAVCDSNIRNLATTNAYVTEGLSCLAVMGLAWALVLLFEKRTAAASALAGAALGACVLVRTIFVLWYPLTALLVLWIVIRGGRARPVARWAVPLSVFVSASVLVPLPWWARNCSVLGLFMPLGTLGGINLPMGYSDIAVNAKGVWAPGGSAAWWSAFDQRFKEMPPLEAERERARFGGAMAGAWIADHPRDLPRLAMGKLADLWRRPLPSRLGWPLALIAVAAFARVRRRPESLVLWALLAFNTFGVVATYGDGVRFLVPVLLVLHILVAMGLAQCFAWLESSAGALRAAQSSPSRP